jgi:hypothetical protein
LNLNEALIMRRFTKSIGLTLLGITVIAASTSGLFAATLSVKGHWPTHSSSPDDDEEDIVLTTTVEPFNRDLFSGKLSKQVLHEIAGVDSTRLTYIYRLWDYRFGAKNRNPNLGDGFEEPTFPPASNDPFTPIAGDPDCNLPPIADPGDAPPQPPYVSPIPEPSTALLGTIAVGLIALTHGRRRVARR